MAFQHLKDYNERFDSEQYLRQFYSTPGSPQNLHDFGARSLHDVLSKWSPETENVRVLDYGCGPVICNIMSVAGRPEVSEIVLAEYTARNREAIQKWLDKDPSAFDWSPYFKHVVKTLEGKTDQEVAKRETRVRSLVKLVSCDITADPPIEKGYGDPYDVVISFLCLDGSSGSLEEYRANMIKLSSFVKPGGMLLLLSTERQPSSEQGSYKVGSQSFFNVCLSYNVVARALEKAYFDVESVTRMGKFAGMMTNSNDYIFISAKKKNQN